MKIIKVYLGTRAVVAYYLAILAVVTLLGAIVYRILFMPSCVVTAQNSCNVDGGTIAGLAAAVLGVGANVLAILGAFAVAAWWRDLNGKVETQVDARTDLRIGTISNNLEAMLQSYTDQRLKVLEEKFEEIRLELEAENKRLWDEKHALQARLNTLQDTFKEESKMLLLGVMRQNPWEIETWAMESATVAPTNEIAYRMALRYLEIVDELQKDEAKQQQYLANVLAPSTDLLYYWEKSNNWWNKITDRTQQHAVFQLSKKYEQLIEDRRSKQQSSH